MKRTLIEVLAIIAVFALLLHLGKTIKDLNTRLAYSVNNEKAYAAERTDLKSKNRTFQLRINQLESSTDSLTRKLKEVANENGIKDKRIKSLQYQLEHYSKTDTIKIQDTIFKDPQFVLDTCVQDEWNKSCLHLKYPNEITMNHEYTNSKYILAEGKRETIKPRKWFLPRWFSKKHTIVEITVIDENPYVITKEQRFIQIVED